METFSSREAQPSTFAREVELLESLPGNLWAGLCARGKELAHVENKELLEMAAGGLAIGAGLAFAARNPEALWGLAGGITRNATKIGLTGAALDVGRRIAMPMWDTYRNPMNLEADKQSLAKNLGGLPLDYAIMGGAAWAGSGAPEALLGVSKLGTSAARALSESLAFEPALRPVTAEGFRFDVPKSDAVPTSSMHFSSDRIQTSGTGTVEDEGELGQHIKERLRDSRSGRRAATTGGGRETELEGDRPDLKVALREERLARILGDGHVSNEPPVTDLPETDRPDLKVALREERLDRILADGHSSNASPSEGLPDLTVTDGQDLKVALRDERLERILDEPLSQDAGPRTSTTSSSSAEGVDVSTDLRTRRWNAILGIQGSV
jgi:hypothetical protein